MNFYLDCEFNGFRGKLISMALVGADGYEWYQVLPCVNSSKWVKEHVIPVLDKKPVSIHRFQSSLEAFLKPYNSVHIISNWPEDIVHFMQTLVTGPGRSIPVKNLTIEIVEFVELKTAIPHNALSDARALKEWMKSF